MGQKKISQLTTGTGEPSSADLIEVSVWTGSAYVSRKFPANKQVESIIIAVSDETTALTTGTGKVTFRMPYGFTLTDVRASLTGAGSTSGTTTVDINVTGAGSILTPKLTIDQGEKTSTTAATAVGITTSTLNDDEEITIDIDAVTGGADETGLKVYLIGYKS